MIASPVGYEDLVPMSLFFAVLGFVILGVLIGMIFFGDADKPPRHSRFFSGRPCSFCGHPRDAHVSYSAFGRGSFAMHIEFCTRPLDSETNTVCNCPGYTDERSTS